MPLVQQIGEGALEMAKPRAGPGAWRERVQAQLLSDCGDVSTSVYYVLGWFVFSLIPIADSLTNIRDAGQCIVNGDSVMQPSIHLE